LNTVDTAFGQSSKSTRPRAALLVVAGIALLVAGVLAVNALTGDDDKSGGQLEGSSRDSFTLSYPEGWRPLSKKRLAALPGNPLAVLRRRDGKGYVVLRREKRAPHSFAQFSGDLTRELKQRVPDFQKQSSRIVKISAGNAFFYSYIRRQRGTVHSVLVVPAGDQSYAINSVSQGGAEKVARETARIILSFDL
jgi:hypothetical protein